MKPFIFTLLLLLSLHPLSADLSQANQSIQADLERSLRELADLRASIADEKLPLATDLNQREAELVQLRREADRLMRLRDSYTLDLQALEREVREQEAQWAYLRNLLEDYLRSFETRIGQAEWSLYQPAIRSALELEHDPDLSFEQRWDHRLHLLQSLIHRNASLPGGRTFKGSAISNDGLLVDGTYLALGPVEWFTDGAAVTGSALRGQTIEPRIAAIPAAEGLQATIESGSGTLWLDPTLGNALLVKETRDSVTERIAKGGIWIWPILFFGLLATVIAAVKLLQILRIREPAPAALQDFTTAIQQQDYTRAAALAANLPQPLRPVLHTIATAGNTPRQRLDELIFEQTLSIQIHLEKGLPVLALAAATTPLLGLLGTVTGMIKTFNLIKVFGSGNAGNLASGISEALITTEFGLIVAIPALVAHAFLVRRAQGVLSHVEATTSSILNASGND